VGKLPTYWWSSGQRENENDGRPKGTTDHCAIRLRRLKGDCTPILRVDGSLVFSSMAK